MEELYRPPHSQLLSAETSKQQIRLGIQGFPGTGKTWSALGFPNPIVGNLDRGLGAHQGRADVLEVPFYKPAVGGKIFEVKDRFIEWLTNHGSKLTENQTLVLDSLSAIESAYHSWFKVNEPALAISKSGKVNDFIEWQLKEQYFNEIHVLIKSFKCDVILLAHETERADKPTAIGQPGMYTGKIRPFLSGKFGDIIIREYTDWFRAHSCLKPTEIKQSTLDAFRMTAQEFKDMMNTFQGDTLYYWQTKGDDLFNAKASSLVNNPMYIPANFTSFKKWMRPQITNKTV